MNFAERTFLTANYTIYLLYVLVYFGVWGAAPHYLHHMKTLLKTYVAVILLYFFNPFTVTNNGGGDGFQRKVAFSAGIFLITGLTLDQVREAITGVTHGFFESLQ